MERYTDFGPNEPLHQGEILCGIHELRFDISQLSQESFKTMTPLSERASHPWSIVLTPACDLEWDFRSRQHSDQPDSKRVTHLLLCDLEDESSVRGDSRIKNRGERDKVESNRDERWYYLPPSTSENGQPFVEFYIDFKRLFSVPTEFVYAATSIGLIQRKGYLKGPWIQHLSHRFTYFLGRVGLPDEP